MASFGGPTGPWRLELWGLGRHEWGDVHFWLAMAALGLVVIRLALHWNWVCCMVERVVTRGRKSGTPRLREVAEAKGWGMPEIRRRIER